MDFCLEFGPLTGLPNQKHNLRFYGLNVALVAIYRVGVTPNVEVALRYFVTPRITIITGLPSRRPTDPQTFSHWSLG
jgi:hypothetical protein